MRKTAAIILTLVLVMNLWGAFMQGAAAQTTKGDIVISDPVLEAMIRQQIGKPEGEITPGDAAGIRELNLEMDGDNRSITRISNLSGLQYFENLVSLDLGWALQGENRQVDLAPLSGLTKLERLTLQCNGITDITAISGLTNLRELWIWGNAISDISMLSGMTKMESIWVFSNHISDISVLKNMPKLYRVLMFENRVMDLSPLAELANLDTLELRDNPIWDYTALTEIYPRLKEKDFDINDPPAFERPENPNEELAFTDAVLEAKIREALGKPEGDITAADAASLDWLDANAPQGTPDSERIKDVAVLRYFVNLNGLRLDNNAIEDISALAELTKLKELWILDNPLYSLEPLSSLMELRKLGFNSGFREVDFLGNMPNLVELRIDACRELPQALVQLKNLKVFCSLGGELADISLLAQIPSLEAVDLSWNRVMDLTPLSALPLTELYLQGNPIEDFSPIKDLYPNLRGRNFEYIQLNQPEKPDMVITFPDPVMEQKVRRAIDKPQGDITAGDAAKITRLDITNEWSPQIPQEVRVHNLQGIEYFINLREFLATFNDISDISVLGGLMQLRNIDLGGNPVEDITVLSSLKNLEALTLFGGRFQDIRPLAGLSMLKFLNIGGIQLYDISPLAGLTKIDNLYLSGCRINDISALCGMTNMNRLQLSDNYITDLTALSGMTNLATLKLANNPIKDYSPIKDIYPKLQEKDFDYGQVFDVRVPSAQEQPDEQIAIAKAGFGDSAQSIETANIHDEAGKKQQELIQPENPDKVIKFPDKVMDRKIREIIGKPEGKITAGDVAFVENLNLGNEWQEKFPKGSQISKLDGIEYFINLKSLEISFNKIEDIRKLADLVKLEYLRAYGNVISSITPLSKLSRLNNLNIGGNKITKIAALKDLVNLTSLYLDGNKIKDFSAIQAIYPNLTDKDFELK